MKITKIETVLLTGPCTNDTYLLELRKRRSAAFIEVHSDEGLLGVGETYAGYFFPEVVPEIVRFFEPILMGQNVDDIADLWSRMYFCGNFWCRVGLGISVLNGIEAALWDLRGKQLGQPVWRLLGDGLHDRILAYATGGPSNYPQEHLARKIDHYLALGFKALKLGAGSFSAERGEYVALSPSAAADFESEKLDFIRTHFGKDIHVMLDGHMGNNPAGTWDLETAQAVMQAVAPFDLFFFEEPLPYTDPRSYRALRESTDVPIAGGECLTSADEWRMYVENRAFDVGQPDASFTGGMLECMQVAQMLERQSAKVATHSWGAGGSLMQNVHLGFACPNTVILEVAPAYGPLHEEVMGDAFRMQDGYVLPPEEPGLGVELTEQLKQRFPFVPGSGEFNSVPGKVLID